MNINELLSQIDNKHIDYTGDWIEIIDLEDKFKDQDIDIHTTRLNVHNAQGGEMTIDAKDILFDNCNFRKIHTKRGVNLEKLDFQNGYIKEFIVDSQTLSDLTIGVEFDNLEINHSNIEYLNIRAKHQEVNKITLINSKVQYIDIETQKIKYISFYGVKNCDELKIHTRLSLAESKSYGDAMIDKLIMFQCDSIKNISISSLEIPFHITNLSIIDFSNLTKFDLERVSIDDAILNSNKVYDKLNANFSDVKISNKFEMKNIDFGQSVFKNLNLSKCIFNNSLISKSLFFECKTEKIPDIPLKKFHKFSLILIFIIPFIAATIGLWKEELFHPFASILLYILGFLVISSFLFFYKHAATLDEKREQHKNFSKEILTDFKEFLISMGKSFKTFFWKRDEKEQLTLEEIESLNRQLKVAFTASKDIQNANEFMYSEMLMKIRQKNIWMNLISVDFWNYMINGFGRRWRRALMNFFIVFLLAVFIFVNSTPFQFAVKEKAPQFIHEANQTLFQTIPLPALDKGFFALIGTAKTTTENNTTQKPEEKVNDGMPILTNLFGLSSVYTLSKIDIFKIKTNGWFEETSFWNFFKANSIGLILLFLLGSFVLAFKRRLDK